MAGALFFLFLSLRSSSHGLSGVKGWGCQSPYTGLLSKRYFNGSNIKPVGDWCYTHITVRKNGYLSGVFAPETVALGERDPLTQVFPAAKTPFGLPRRLQSIQC